jgi:Mg-chelatase subunit ChlD
MRFLLRFLFLVGTFLPGATLRAAEDDVAIAIVYDTSGSMAGQVKDSANKPAPKFEIANRALESIFKQLEQFQAKGGKKLQVGLFTFTPQGGQAVVPLGPFDAAKLRGWLGDFKKPDGGTPLGAATAEAARALLAAKVGSRHVLVVTDGENTIGPPPEQVIPKLYDQAIKAGQSLQFHFVAFDVKAAVFAGVKKQGATLVSAADEKQLTEQLTFVLEEKILLEKE